MKKGPYGFKKSRKGLLQRFPTGAKGITGAQDGFHERFLSRCFVGTRHSAVAPGSNSNAVLFHSSCVHIQTLQRGAHLRFK